MPKILKIAALSRRLSSLRKRGKKIVFTNGCFDIIHPGHVKVFRFAKSLGDTLVVGVNTDASVRKLKGPSRPVSDDKSRALVVSAMESVDYVVLFGEGTPLKIIKKIRPDVLVKGADYSSGKIVGAEYAGRVVRVPLAKNHSTTRLISRIKQCEK
ncbi:MAG: D-glycero-beta-D-manno-heptose 1-phosphate adenylyltransferase [Elusimicrobia bacterium HGW-Elusimicrobia-1]|jgi:D-beta-D-heptose 7-phosphate kinase/D-beta-D-heptose 1-phosphate adenosyltransferase|nr:MAG: D-glycero-beta-D-manno-heptose 1-phosphate adenylyltransferase [Elusimicrobia bacterium HGW-Elusimicrobia-1]